MYVPLFLVPKPLILFPIKFFRQENWVKNECLFFFFQVEHGLVDRKGNYDFMFSINTSSRIYFLAVDTQQEMDTWVNMVCKACGLRDTSEEMDSATTSEVVATSTNASTLASSRQHPGMVPQAAIRSQPAQKPLYENTANLSAIPHLTQPKPSISSPYIHISECFSGKAPPKPPPRFRSSESTGSNRHDSSTDDEPVIFFLFFFFFFVKMF